jgi:hypothetical protein
MMNYTASFAGKKFEKLRHDELTIRAHGAARRLVEDSIFTLPPTPLGGIKINGISYATEKV